MLWSCVLCIGLARHNIIMLRTRERVRLGGDARHGGDARRGGERAMMRTAVCVFAGERSEV
jgi:hypothetical protein